MTLTTHHLEFTATALTRLELDDQTGASIRGAVVGRLWESFCANKAAPTCADCPLIPVCPVAELIAPMREAGETGGAQRPWPYVLRPPADHMRRYDPDAALSFGLALIGPVARLFPYLVMAAQAIEQSGLGRRMPATIGRHGALQLIAITAVDPLAGARHPLYQRDHAQVQAPGLPITAADVAAYAAALRLIESDRLVKRFDPRPFVQRLAWRLDQLAVAYGGGAPLCDRAALTAQLDHLTLADDQTTWIDMVSYSSRSRQRTPISGLVCQVTLAGELAQLRELLVWGSLIHVGKNAVKGDG